MNTLTIYMHADFFFFFLLFITLNWYNEWTFSLQTLFFNFYEAEFIQGLFNYKYIKETCQNILFHISICNISMKNLDVSSLYNDGKKRFLQVDKSDFIFKFIVLFTVYLKTICTAIKRSCAASAITLVKDNTRASIIYSISLVNISCLLFSRRYFVLFLVFILWQVK